MIGMLMSRLSELSVVGAAIPACPRHCSRVGMISIPPNTTTCFPSPL